MVASRELGVYRNEINADRAISACIIRRPCTRTLKRIQLIWPGFHS